MDHFRRDRPIFRCSPIAMLLRKATEGEIYRFCYTGVDARTPVAAYIIINSHCRGRSRAGTYPPCRTWSLPFDLTGNRCLLWAARIASLGGVSLIGSTDGSRYEKSASIGASLNMDARKKSGSEIAALENFHRASGHTFRDAFREGRRLHQRQIMAITNAHTAEPIVMAARIPPAVPREVSSRPSPSRMISQLLAAK